MSTEGCIYLFVAIPKHCHDTFVYTDLSRALSCSRKGLWAVGKTVLSDIKMATKSEGERLSRRHIWSRAILSTAWRSRRTLAIPFRTHPPIDSSFGHPAHLLPFQTGLTPLENSVRTSVLFRTPFQQSRSRVDYHTDGFTDWTWSNHRSQ